MNKLDEFIERATLRLPQRKGRRLPVNSKPTYLTVQRQ